MQKNDRSIPFSEKDKINMKLNDYVWNYVWLHFHSPQRSVQRLLWLCGYWVPKSYFS